MPFEIFDSQQNKPELSGTAQAIRGATGLAGRAFEGLVGAPGSIASLGTNIVNAISGGSLGSYEEARKKYPFLPPTISEFRQATKNLTGEILEPQSRKEEIAQNVAEKLGSGLATGIPFGTNIALSIGGEIGKQVAKSLGAGPNVQALAEIGSELFLGSRLNKKSLEKFSKKSYEALDNLPKSVLTSTAEFPNTEKALNKIFQSSFLGISTPGKEFVLKKADEFAHKIKNGKVSFEDFWQYKKDLNNLTYEATIPRGTQPYISQLAKAARQDIQHIAKNKKNSPYRILLDADQTKFALEKAKDASQLISKRLDQLTVGDASKEILKNLLGPAIGYGAKGVGGAVIGTLVPIGKSKYNYYSTLLKNSPQAQKLYGQLIVNALKNNVNALDNSIKVFDKEIEKNSSKDRFEIFD